MEYQISIWDNKSISDLPHPRFTFSRANLSVHLHSKTCLVFLCRYSIVKEQILLSTKRRNFNSQFGVENSSYELTSIGIPPLANRQCIGGGEGIRTPDPRVANAVLCQLSYTPDKYCRLPIFDCRLERQTRDAKSTIGNRQLTMVEIGCGGGI